MAAHQHSNTHMREELRQLLDSDFWKHLSMPTKEKVLIMLDEYKWEYLNHKSE